MRAAKPILHHRDHERGGADEIQGLGGDYAFLGEQIVESDGDPLVVSDIAQGYRHLVLEIMLQATVDFPTVTDACIAWNSITTEYDWAQSSVDTGGASASNVTDDGGVNLTALVPEKPGTDPLFAFITGKFPYYSVADTIKGFIWQAVSLNDGIENVISATGGGLSVYQIDEGEAHTDPVTSFELIARETGGIFQTGRWAAGSRVSYYGIT